MTALTELAGRLAAGDTVAGRALPAAQDLDLVIATLRRHARQLHPPLDTEDALRAAVLTFRSHGRLGTLKEARRVCYALAMPIGADTPCLLADGTRLAALFEALTPWRAEPRWYRRCYQGLLHSYFNVDPQAPGTGDAARRHWLDLRDYLARHLGELGHGEQDPEWVLSLRAAPALLSAQPCAPWADVLQPDLTRMLDKLCHTLGIGPASWWHRSLLQEQAEHAARQPDAAFLAALPLLLPRLARDPAEPHPAMAVLLRRAVQCAQAPATPAPHPALHGLRDLAARRWGCPWSAANAPRWSGLDVDTLSQVSRWIQLKVLHDFFAHRGGAWNERRARFWSRYVRALDSIHLIADAADPRAQALDGLIWPGPLTPHTPTALALRFGPWLMLEFDTPEHGWQVYDETRRPVAESHEAAPCGANGGGILPIEQRVLRLPHLDAPVGWPDWETQFESTLRQRFGLRPGQAGPGPQGRFIDLADGGPALDAATGPDPHEPIAPAGAPLSEDVHWHTAEAAVVPFSRPDLAVFARLHALTVDDRRAQGHGLWVRGDDSDPHIRRVLAHWGFAERAGQGWHRPRG